MKEAYQFLIDLKTQFPLSFWVIMFIGISLILFAIQKLIRNKQKAKMINLNKKGTSLEPDSEKKTAKPKNAPKKEITKFLTQQTKVYSKRFDKTKQELVIPKVETVENKPLPKPKSEKQPPKVIIENTQSKKEVKIVNYDIPNPPLTHSYPIFRFPKKDTVIRSYRIGKAKLRGFKEESFQKSIEQYFGNDFKVLGNVRLNTGIDTRPYEPDIAIIDYSNSNLRIDIEIDEPYAGITRQPTHCKGENDNRDFYFIDRGWIVIRFSEFQVHLNEIACLKFIAGVIKSAIPNFNIPYKLKIQNDLLEEKFWDIVQAQKWEKNNYRENYLNHRFETIEEEIKPIKRDFNEQELKEEKLVKPTLIGEVEIRESISFNLNNAHLRDSRIKFYPEPHIYTIDNIPAPSASTIIDKFFPEFDSFEKARNLSPSNPLYGNSVEEIVEIWSSRGQEAANQGRLLHEQIEKFYLGQQYVQTQEFHLFEQFHNDHPNLGPYRTEWRIFDEEYHIGGTIDLISKNNNGYEIYDWKRSKKIIDVLNGDPIKTDPWKKVGVGQLSNIPDTSYNRYCLQQSLYKYILEKNYGLTVNTMFLIVLYPDYNKYYKVKVPYLKDETEYILKTL